MTPEEQCQLEGLVIFWKHARDNITERRKYEWRFTYAIWAALGSIAIALILKDIALKLLPEIVWFARIALFLIFSSICWAHLKFLTGVGERHNHDRELSRSILDAIKAIHGLQLPKKYVDILDKSRPATSIRDWSRKIQFFITIGLALIDCILFEIRLLNF